MSSLINETIREILMEEQQVCLPGIGTIRLDPQPAVVSPIEGRVLPPSDRATFNSNLVLDDGRVLRSLQEIPVLTDTEAELLLQGYLQNIQENLDAGRSVTLEGIGRLFKHFDGEVRFTAGSENFSKENFGLPAVEIKPIARTERQRRTAADPMLAGAGAAASRPATAAPGSDKQPGIATQILQNPNLKQALWYIAALMATAAILILGYLVLTTLADNSDKPSADRRDDAPLVIEEPPRRQPLPPVDADRVIPDEPPRLGEARPAPAEDNTAANTAARAASEDPTSTTPRSSTPEEPVVANPPIESNSPYNTAFIATGLYGSSANVTKNVNRINKAGYEAFDRREGRYTRVGVRVRYTDRGDLMETLRAVQKTYDDAFVMEINGEKVRID